MASSSRRAVRWGMPLNSSASDRAMDDLFQPEQYEAAIHKFANPVRVLAESAILRYIGELTGEAESRYQAINGVCFPGMDGIGEFEVGASVTVSQMEGIRALWKTEKANNAHLSPMEFARANAQGAFYPGIEICDP